MLNKRGTVSLKLGFSLSVMLTVQVMRDGHFEMGLAPGPAGRSFVGASVQARPCELLALGLLLV